MAQGTRKGTEHAPAGPKLQRLRLTIFGFALLTLTLVATSSQAGVVVPADIDIKPGSCPNAWNRNSKGVLAVAVLGRADFDVTQIDASTVMLGRADMLSGTAPVEPPDPDDPEPQIEDVAAPISGDQCDCQITGPDGFLDHWFKFDTQDAVALLPVDDPVGALVPLEVSGDLLDGTSFVSTSDTECVLVRGRW